MAMLGEQDIKDIRNSVNIVDVISSYLPLTRKGKNFFGICPFHNDNNPSMSVSEEKQIFTCFSCGKTGNVFTFLMDYEHISFMESVKKIASIAGIAVDIKTSKKKNSNNLYEIYDLSNKFYQNNLFTKKGVEAINYLNQRGITEDIIKEFQIGLALKDRDVLTNLLVKKEYSYNDMVKSGLISKTNDGYKDMYYNRIMFPLWNLDGQVVGYSGRIYHNEDSSKYINTKETEIFKKGEILYNFHRAKDIARNLDQIIIMEGFMDVIRAYSVGIKNVVATMGTAVTSNQVNILKKMAHNIIICFDGDEAGLKASISLTNDLVKLGINPKIVRLKDDLDPDEYIKKYGKDSFIDNINNPLNVMDFKMAVLKRNKDLTSTLDISKYTEDMLKEISLIKDDILKEVTLNKLSEETKLDINFLRKKLPLKEKKVVVKKSSVKLDKYEKASMYLIYYMLDNKEIVNIYKNKGVSISNSEFSSLALAILSYYNKYKDITLADFISNNSNNPKMLDLISKVVNLDLDKNYDIKDIEDYIKVINEYNVKCEIKRLMMIQKETTDRKEKLKIAETIRNLRMEGNKDD